MNISNLPLELQVLAWEESKELGKSYSFEEFLLMSTGNMFIWDYSSQGSSFWSIIDDRGVTEEILNSPHYPKQKYYEIY